MKVKDIFENRPVVGQVGVEIEVEGHNLPREAIGWNSEMDGSLRGESMEYVLSRPSMLKDLPEHLDMLKKAFKDSRGEFFEGYRAGTHIHINVQDLTGIELASMITAYSIFDKSLVGICRKERQGNHFCMRLCDTPGLGIALQRIFAKKEIKKFKDDLLRYSSLNITSLPKFGSLEFRSLESTYNFDKVVSFATMHQNIKDWSQTVVNPTQVVAVAREIGPRRMAEAIFGENAKLLLQQATVFEDFEMGVEFAEEFAYCANWGVKSLDIFSKEENCW